MRFATAASTACVLALAAVTAANASTMFEATLDGLQDVPAIPEVTATGTATFVLNDAQTQLTYHIQFSGLSSAEIDAHIHNAPPRDNGPVVFSLPLGSSIDGVWDIPAAMVTELYAGRLYVNIHTEMYVLGEIRGDIHQSPTAVPSSTPAAGVVLAQNFPNPFNPTTVIRFALPAAMPVELAVFDLRGSRVRTLVSGRRGAGPHQAAWDGRDETGRAVASGVYFCRLRAGGAVRTRRMVLLK